VRCACLRIVLLCWLLIVGVGCWLLGWRNPQAKSETRSQTLNPNQQTTTPTTPQESLKQQDWKIERLTRDNRALEASNCDLRRRVDAVRDENLQVSEKILALDEEGRALRLAAGEAEARSEALGREKGQLQVRLGGGSGLGGLRVAANGYSLCSLLGRCSRQLGW